MKKEILKNLIAGVAVASAVAVAAPSFAQGNFYIGAGVSQSFIDEDGLDEDDTGGKIYGGYKFNQYLAIEGAYYDFGEIDNGRDSLELDGVSLAVVGSVPVSERFSLFGKVGAHDWDATASGPIAGQLSSDSDTDAFYGIGIEYDFGNSLSLRGELERYEVEDLDVDVATVGISFSF